MQHGVFGSSALQATNQEEPRLGLAFLVYSHVVICCISLVFVMQVYAPMLRLAPIDEKHLYFAALSVAPFALVSIVFTISRFSFGYVLGFNFYTIVLGYLWLVNFSTFPYDHALAYASAFACGIAFLVPALFVIAPAKQKMTISVNTFNNLLTYIVIAAAAVIVVGGSFNLKFVGLYEIYSFRNDLRFPVGLQYAMGITSNVLLPFAFACYVSQQKRWRAGLTLSLLLLFYPITLTKTALLAPIWLLVLTFASRLFEARTTVVMSLLAPLLLGVLLTPVLNFEGHPYKEFMAYFGTVNFRMIALPSSAFDFYNDFFSKHDLTHFCQISVLKPLMDCAYSDPLGVVMQKTYQIGNFNASLFATEGIASVGNILAPISVFCCGLVISFGNTLSSGLPSKFILLSSGVICQTFMNVPFTVTFVTGGAGVLYLLWYITPRSIFENPT